MMVSEKIKKVQAELRSLLQRPKNKTTWDAITAQLGYIFPSETGEEWYGEKWSAAQLAQLEEEVLAGVERELKRAWPAQLREVTMWHHPRVKRLGGVLNISFYGSSMKQFGAAHGKVYKNNAISKKQIGELMPHWLGGGRYEGFVLEHVDKLHWELVEALIAANGEPLRSLRMESVGMSVEQNPYRFRVEELEALMEQLITRCGQTLERFGATLSSSESAQKVDALYGPLLRRGAELPALIGLGFTKPPLYERDIFHELMASPAFDQLKELSFPQDLTVERGATLMQRAASRNLRRVGVGHLHDYNKGLKLNVRAMIHAPNLASVQVWDLRTERRDDAGWETPEAAVWREVVEARGEQGKERVEARRASALEQEVVDLAKMDAAATRELLWQDGALRASAHLKALRVRQVDEALLRAIIADGATAWPALECLVFQQRISSRESLQAWASSPLLAQLLFLDWDDFDHPDMRAMHNHADKVASQATRMAQLEHILSGAEPPFLAFRRWRHARSTLTRNPDRVAVARRLGISKKEQPATSEALMSLCEQHVIALLGGKKGLLTWGPTYARHDWTEAFSWPDPVYNREEDRPQ
jgi:hypothetical protein